MRDLKVPNPGATVALGVFLLVTNVGVALYAAQGREPSGLFDVLYYFGIAMLVWYWIQKDSRRLRVSGVTDQALVFFGWPLALPYHLFKTRGLKGGLTLLGLVALYLLTYAIALAVWFAMTRTARGA